MKIDGYSKHTHSLTHSHTLTRTCTSTHPPTPPPPTPPPPPSPPPPPLVHFPVPHTHGPILPFYGTVQKLIIFLCFSFSDVFRSLSSKKWAFHRMTYIKISSRRVLCGSCSAELATLQSTCLQSSILFRVKRLSHGKKNKFRK